MICQPGLRDPQAHIESKADDYGRQSEADPSGDEDGRAQVVERLKAWLRAVHHGRRVARQQGSRSSARCLDVIARTGCQVDNYAGTMSMGVAQSSTPGRWALRCDDQKQPGFPDAYRARFIPCLFHASTHRGRRQKCGRDRHGFQEQRIPKGISGGVMGVRHGMDRRRPDGYDSVDDLAFVLRRLTTNIHLEGDIGLPRDSLPDVVVAGRPRHRRPSAERSVLVFAGRCPA